MPYRAKEAGQAGRRQAQWGLRSRFLQTAQWLRVAQVVVGRLQPILPAEDLTPPQMLIFPRFALSLRLQDRTMDLADRNFGDHFSALAVAAAAHPILVWAVKVEMAHAAPAAAAAGQGLREARVAMVVAA